MIKSVTQLIEKIEISPRVKYGLTERYEKIKAKDTDWKTELNWLLNYICPNLTRVEKKPNPALIDTRTGGGTKRDWERYNEQNMKYTYENSQGQFPYTKESYDELIKYINEIEMEVEYEDDMVLGLGDKVQIYSLPKCPKCKQLPTYNEDYCPYCNQKLKYPEGAR